MPEEFSLDLDSVLNRKYPGTEHIDPKRTALIVVDMQRFFLEPGQPAYLPGGDGAPSAETVIENSVKAVDLCRRHGIQVIWSRWGLRGDGWDVGRWAPKWPTVSILRNTVTWQASMMT